MTSPFILGPRYKPYRFGQCKNIYQPGRNLICMNNAGWQSSSSSSSSSASASSSNNFILYRVRKEAKIRKRYNQVPHLNSPENIHPCGYVWNTYKIGTMVKQSNNLYLRYFCWVNTSSSDQNMERQTEPTWLMSSLGSRISSRMAISHP